ncbi:MAG TPA: YciI family protein [Pseudonocardiaceae bacterium]|nr:YciI family protein [Pseudonocardiaceae bacterium]
MKYLLMICFNDDTWDALSEAEHQDVFQAHAEFQKLITESGEMLGTEALAGPSHSVTVRVRDEAPMITDGPFVESKEYLAGYYLVDCDSRARAAELATMLPEAKFAAIEVRPLMNFDGADVIG